MQLLCKVEDREIWLEELQRPFEFFDPFSGEKFVCILLVNDFTITAKEQEAICDKIIAYNCQFAVCTGIDCFSWHDSIDRAFIANNENFFLSDERFIMTSCHEEESLSEVIYFALNYTNFNSHQFKKYLILMVGKNDEILEEITKATLLRTALTR